MTLMLHSHLLVNKTIQRIFWRELWKIIFQSSCAQFTSTVIEIFWVLHLNSCWFWYKYFVTTQLLLLANHAGICSKVLNLCSLSLSCLFTLSVHYLSMTSVLFLPIYGIQSPSFFIVKIRNSWFLEIAYICVTSALPSGFLENVG